MHTQCQSENLKGRDHLVDLGIDENIKMDLKQDVRVWTGFNWLSIRTREHNNEPSGSIKCRECLKQLSDYQLLKGSVCSIDLAGSY
jgi:hypothetical protein